MPRLIPIRLAAACALALVLLLSTAAIASAKGAAADLRVVGSGGKVLAEETLGAGHDLGPDQPEGDLLRQGHRRQRQGGRRSKAPTALGLLAQAAKSTTALKPLLITDCLRLRPRALRGRRLSATTKLSWYLKVNHKNPELGGELGQAEGRRRSALGAGALPLPERAGAERAGRGDAGRAVRRSASSPTTTRASASRPRARR